VRDAEQGEPIVAAVEFLSGVLDRMESHQSKKTAMLRKLSISENLPTADNATAFLAPRPAAL